VPVKQSAQTPRRLTLVYLEWRRPAGEHEQEISKLLEGNVHVVPAWRLGVPRPARQEAYEVLRRIGRDVDAAPRERRAHLARVEPAVAVLVEVLEDIPQLAFLVPEEASAAGIGQVSGSEVARLGWVARVGGKIAKEEASHRWKFQKDSRSNR